jgi:hypothetical protein
MLILLSPSVKGHCEKLYRIVRCVDVFEKTERTADVIDLGDDEDMGRYKTT